MSTDDDKKGAPAVSHTTNIGSVTGQVHTGSGDIIVKSFTAGTISNKDEFLAALKEFKAELDAARQHGLEDEAIDDAIVEVEAAERETQKETPKADRLIGRLEKAKSILVSSTGVATAMSGAITATNKLIPMIENAVHVVGRLF
jgi:hypothetical protein